MDSNTRIESGIIGIVLPEEFFLGILSSKIHVIWALATGGTLEDRPVYNNTLCFDTFPFPIATKSQKKLILDLGKRLDTHRKRQQDLHPDLTMTNMYNVLEKERNGELLTAKEKKIHEQGLISILRQIHDELDAAVADAYGWPADLSEDEILERLVQLNAERAAEEAQGLIRWLRPEYQAPDSVQTGVQGTLVEVEKKQAVSSGQEKRPWPDSLAQQAANLREVLSALEAPADLMAIASHFEGKRTKKRLEQVERLLETLVALGQAEEIDEKWRG